MPEGIRKPCQQSVHLSVVAVNTLAVIFFAPAHSADQPLGLSLRHRETIRLADAPQNGRVYDLAFSPRREPPVCAFALERCAQVWEVAERAHRLATFNPPRPKEAVGPDYWGYAHGLAFTSDGGRLAMGYFGMVQIWDFDRRKILYGIPATWEPKAVGFTETASSLVVGCTWEGMFTVSGDFPGKVEVRSKEEYERMPVKDPTPFAAGAFSRQPRIRIDPPEMRNVYCLAVYPDGKRFAAGGGSVFDDTNRAYRSQPSVTVWDLALGRRILEIGSKENPIRRFCISPDGRTLYSSGNKVLGWDAGKPGPPLREFDAHGKRMISVAISPDGTMLAAGGQDGTVVIWDTKTARRLGTLTHDAGPVHRLAFSPTSMKPVAAGEGGVATLWTVELHSAKKE